VHATARVYPRSHTERGVDPPRRTDRQEAFRVAESVETTARVETVPVETVAVETVPVETLPVETVPVATVALVDDPDESTVLEVTDPDDEPTMICPPLPGAAIQRAEVARGSTPRRRRRIGKYELCDKLGRGAFGVVYTARDPSLDRQVAIKVLRPAHLANPTIVQRFLQEARATARIAHPCIVTIHDCGQVETSVGATAFIAMELLSGESLTGRLARCGRLPPEAAIEIVRQVASALEAAHRADVLHRDLKPDNIYLVLDPAIPRGERVKVLDFGLAKLGHDGNTQLKTVFGTPRYMSPEQWRSAAQVDHRSDIYSLGCILFELVTGAAPFDGEVRQLLEHHQCTIAPRARSLAAEVPPALDELIADMLAKDPMDRPQTMGAVQRGLQRAGDALVEAATVPPPRAASSPGAPARASSPTVPPRAASSPGAPARASSPTVPPRAASSPGAPARAPSSPAPPRELDAEAASGEILVPPSGSRPVLTVEMPAPPVARLSSVKLVGLGVLVVALSVLIAWITAG
jgi:eukaryotic-like serine/threonine-protein kinase